MALKPRRTAIVLNGNARSVTRRTIEEVGRLITDQSLFVSRSLEQSHFICRQIIKGGTDVVLCGGVDGTFTHVVSEIMALNPVRAPAFGALRLGTGNAIASALGAAGRDRDGLAQDLRYIAASGETVVLPLVRVEGKLAPFAGCGMDVMILQDYAKLKDSLPVRPVRGLMEGPLGYACSIATRSLWRYLSRPLPEVVIRNEGESATRVDLAGATVGRPIARGEVIYRGPASLAAVATIPYAGFGVRLYPQAGKRVDRLHLRVGQAGVGELLSHLSGVLHGQFESARLFDFYCTAISIHVPRGTPFQVGGDLLGPRTNLYLSLDHVEAVPGSAGTELFSMARQTPASLRSARLSRVGS